MPIATDITALSKPSSQARGQDEGKSDDQQWEILGDSEADTATDPPPGGISSHFDLHLGWGDWKFTVFSWDLKITPSARRNG
jgi:hypothetical protein